MDDRIRCNVPGCGQWIGPYWQLMAFHLHADAPRPTPADLAQRQREARRQERLAQRALQQRQQQVRGLRKEFQDIKGTLAHPHRQYRYRPR